MKHKTKIFISYYKPSILFDNNIFIPINVNSLESERICTDDEFRKFKSRRHDISKEEAYNQLNWLRKHTISDKENNPFSAFGYLYAEFPIFNFITNNIDKLIHTDVKYIGIMQYRKLLNLNRNYEEECLDNLRKYTSMELPSNSNISIDTMLGITEENVDSILDKGYKLIIPQRDFKTLEKEYNFFITTFKLHPCKLLYFLCDIIYHIERFNPQITLCKHKEYWFSSEYMFHHNLFIADRKIFLEISYTLSKIIEYIFNVYQKKTNSFILLNSCEGNYRLWGHILENLLSFILWCYQQDNKTFYARSAVFYDL